MNALWLMLGTLTSVRVPAPTHVDRRVAGRAMVLAPLGGALLALFTAGPLWLAVDQDWGLSGFVLAALVLGALALLTRGMHLDGLADVADGLGSGRRDAAALVIMKQSDIGPFGVVTLVVVLLVQAAALAQAITMWWGPGALALALVVSRGVLPLVCTRFFPAARPDGLGATVATSVGTLGAVVALGLVAVAGAVLVPSLVDSFLLDGATLVRLAVACLGALVPGVLLALHARRRFGGVTGDVYGAAVEVTFTASLVLTLIAA
ncbi:adenosylcobinamide-GDP ribazoletransferase [Nocardioides jensenii]|uniref:adenosylcobinamide-GDP ribazoletransferase n=1 Tax=Nocardioides jensenii TaxID=1843 RepID=UPI000B2E0C10|nr:adenosylcobinamide-GDP ribazoletransferase [Nocardioides jensenii]